MSDFEFGELRNFVYVAETRSFTEAARRAHLSTPAISKSIKRLEQKLEASLFERTSRRVDLTLAGQALLVHARAVLEAMATFGHALDRPEGQLAGALSIGTTDAVGPGICAHALAGLIAAHPHCVPEVRRHDLATLASELRAGRLDIALYFGPELAVDGAHHETLGTAPLCLLGRSPQAAPPMVEGVSPSGTGPTLVVPREFERSLRASPQLAALPIGMRVDGIDLALAVARSSDLVAVVPGTTAHGATKREGLALLTGRVGTPLRLGLTSRRRGLSTRAFKSALSGALHGVLAVERAA